MGGRIELELGQIIKAHCNRCGPDTRHKVLHIAKQRFEDDVNTEFEENSYYTLQCEGCHSVKLREDWYGSWSGNGEPTYFPPPSLRKQPEWVNRWWQPPALGNPVFIICREVYNALQNNLPHLAAMGVRAVLEQAMISKIGGDRRSFAQNLRALADQGHVSTMMRDRLERVLDAGSATIHRGHTPSSEDLTTLVDIMEHVIESLYFHDASVARLAGRTPPRQSKAAS
ncbi:DUF4145 domain-containing protein [Ralstonia mannitolilytica]|uniref:DUF4145 domain-containing protein n=1 Tax=Ralstonia mannitolilytica TaxID=105219 RepID=A0AAD2EGX3_9RALS|nr:DUF4145 domain-containing protein [Ralstonia mannitolilytica]MBY4717469.1 DUF4145 domain-containing protein [Ralstonia mannitolilytica]CAJ0684603.1 hypothetical protein R77591_02538 [Ralstonia mannitolilytica]CAJ0874718.1 hypothetical protein R77569_02644 [Ralstonia mannitolilytica]